MWKNQVKIALHELLKQKERSGIEPYYEGTAVTCQAVLGCGFLFLQGKKYEYVTV